MHLQKRLSICMREKEIYFYNSSGRDYAHLRGEEEKEKGDY